jgi:hypothetical protein
MARSSSDECDIGRPNSAGRVVASTRTLEVGQAAEAPGGEARSPLAHGAGVAVEFPRHLVVGGAVASAAAEGDPAAEGLRLRGGVGVGHLLELLPFLAGQADEWRASGHEARSMRKRGDPWNQRPATRCIEPNTAGALEARDSHYEAELLKPTTSRPGRVRTGRTAGRGHSVRLAATPAARRPYGGRNGSRLSMQQARRPAAPSQRGRDAVPSTPATRTSRRGNKPPSGALPGANAEFTLRRREPRQAASGCATPGGVP